MAKALRFVDPETNLILYPGDPETPSSAEVNPVMGTNGPPLGAIVMNPLLASATQLQWDATHPIEPFTEHWTGEQKARLSQSATQPPTGLLELRSRLLPWRIQVRPRTPNVVVTVYDVITAIREGLMVRITQREGGRFDGAGKRLIVAARAARIQGRDPDYQAEELFYHPRRVDCLGEFTQFAGLAPAPQQSPNLFDLKFRRRS